MIMAGGEERILKKEAVVHFEVIIAAVVWAD
jgi:hypothetical protein